MPLSVRSFHAIGRPAIGHNRIPAEATWRVIISRRPSCKVGTIVTCKSRDSKVGGSDINIEQFVKKQRVPSKTLLPTSVPPDPKFWDLGLAKSDHNIAAITGVSIADPTTMALATPTRWIIGQRDNFATLSVSGPTTPTRYTITSRTHLGIAETHTLIPCGASAIWESCLEKYPCRRWRWCHRIHCHSRIRSYRSSRVSRSQSISSSRSRRN